MAAEGGRQGVLDWCRANGCPEKYTGFSVELDIAHRFYSRYVYRCVVYLYRYRTSIYQGRHLDMMSNFGLRSAPRRSENVSVQNATSFVDRVRVVTMLMLV